ncbi:MAG: nitrophenyl compound nitroreductase subunit ArsF family protein, partial [Candidatus Omnitrophica bacterium]|nr:nitrophenyl compound nitroreductase subunit ArsF family protein [Candidatus Omnitrophota bacterium]
CHRRKNHIKRQGSFSGRDKKVHQGAPIMKKIILIAVFVFLCLGFVMAEDSAGSKIIAYYFHGDYRCSNCYKIEQYSKEAIDKYFAKELASGELEYKVVNIDEKGNGHFAEDYKLYTRSLVISRIKGGKEVEYKNLEKVWNYLDNKGAFHNYVKEEITKFLEENK